MAKVIGKKTIHAMVFCQYISGEEMANAKGNPDNLTSFPRVGKEPVGGVIPVRFFVSDEVKLRAMKKGMQQFIRDAVAEKLDRCKQGEV